MAKSHQVQDGKEFLAIPVLTITQTQLQALRDSQTWLPERLDPLRPMLQEMLAAYEGTVHPHKKLRVKTRLATDVKSLQKATTLVGVEHDHNSADYALFLNGKTNQEMEKSWRVDYDAVIKTARSGTYLRMLDRLRESSKFSRTILDLILSEMNIFSENLKNETAHKHKKFFLGTDVTMAIKVIDNDDNDGKPTIVIGQPDQVIAYASYASTTSTTTGNLLIIVEAKLVKNTCVGTPQLIIYMAAAAAAAQKSTSRNEDHHHQSNNNNKKLVVWGILSDGGSFCFFCLTDAEKKPKLLTSPTLEWRFHAEQIVNHIDTIICDIVGQSSSPLHMTTSQPQRTDDSISHSSYDSSYGMGKYLVGSWHIGPKTEEDEQDEQGKQAEKTEEDETESESEPEVLDIVYRNGHLLLKERTNTLG